MPNLTHKLSLLLAVLCLGAAPAVALADKGSDDPPGDDRGGQRDDSGSDDSSGRGRGGDDDDSSGGGRDDRVERRVAGSCTGGTTSKIKAKTDDGRLEVEFEVDQNRSGVEWRVRIRRNDDVVVRTRATTGGRSGSFSVERKIDDPAGTDRISGRAVSPTGEVCRATVSI